MSDADPTQVSPPVTTTARTLTAAEQIICDLTSDDHASQPGTVIVSAGHITILPEHPEVPIHALLTWADHLDGDVEWDAAVLTQGTRAAFITAKGTIDGITTRVSASTIRVTDEFIATVKSAPPDKPAPITKHDVVELASVEDILGV
jgi:hypothetical protein